MKSESDRPKHSTRLRVCTASVETQAKSKRGRLPKGSLVSTPDCIYSVKGPLTRLY